MIKCWKFLDTCEIVFHTILLGFTRSRSNICIKIVSLLKCLKQGMDFSWLRGWTSGYYGAKWICKDAKRVLGWTNNKGLWQKNCTFLQFDMKYVTWINLINVHKAQLEIFWIGLDEWANSIISPDKLPFSTLIFFTQNCADIVNRCDFLLWSLLKSNLKRVSLNVWCPNPKTRSLLMKKSTKPTQIQNCSQKIFFFGYLVINQVNLFVFRTMLWLFSANWCFPTTENNQNNHLVHLYLNLRLLCQIYTIHKLN